LTQAFLKAQYSPEPVETEEAAAVKGIWKRIRAYIKKRRGFA
jgi:hypothetical protein